MKMRSSNSQSWEWFDGGNEWPIEAGGAWEW